MASAHARRCPDSWKGAGGTARRLRATLGATPAETEAERNAEAGRPRTSGGNAVPEGLGPDYNRFLRCLRDGAFSVVTLQTTTGLATADFDLWPNSCRMLLMVGALMGACAGSTGGGAKLWRILVAARASLAAVRGYVRPRAVVMIRMDGENLSDGPVVSATRFFMLWILTGAIGVILLSMPGWA